MPMKSIADRNLAILKAAEFFKAERQMGFTEFLPETAQARCAEVEKMLWEAIGNPSVAAANRIFDAANMGKEVKEKR